MFTNILNFILYTCPVKHIQGVQIHRNRLQAKDRNKEHMHSAAKKLFESKQVL